MNTAGTELKAALDTLGTLGTIKVGTMDTSPNTLGALYEYGGMVGHGQFGYVGVKYEKPAIQLMFRGEPNDYTGPMDKSIIAYRYLAAIQPGALGSGPEYLTVVPQGVPYSLGQDNNKRYEIVCNYYVTKERS